jgi:hypothetical protein
VRPVLCVDDFSYWAGLNEAWDSDVTICNVEHDIELADSHLDELLACPYGACTYIYRCHWISTGIPGGVIAAGRGERRLDQSADPKCLRGGEHWASWSAIGLIKVTREARVAPLRREPWQRLELAVHDATERPWHAHWGPDGRGVTHHHY